MCIHMKQHGIIYIVRIMLCFVFVLCASVHFILITSKLVSSVTDYVQLSFIKFQCVFIFPVSFSSCWFSSSLWYGHSLCLHLYIIFMFINIWSSFWELPHQLWQYKCIVFCSIYYYYYYFFHFKALQSSFPLSKRLDFLHKNLKI